MYCKNCGSNLNEGAAICTKCGFEVGKGTHFCGHCGKLVNEGASVCLNCGCSLAEVNDKQNANISGLKMVIQIFMALGCALYAFLGSLYLVLALSTMLELLILAIGMFIPLIWCVPMTIFASRRLKKNSSTGMVHAVCTLLFVNIIAGILLLVYNNSVEKI